MYNPFAKKLLKKQETKKENQNMQAVRNKKPYFCKK